MTIAQQQFATANAQLHEMSQAMEAAEDAEIVATRKMESAETSAKKLKDQAMQLEDQHRNKLEEHIHEYKQGQRKRRQIGSNQKTGRNNSHQP